MKARTLGFIALSIAGAAIFVRLGVWQVSRLHEKQRINAEMSVRLAAPPVSIDSLSGPADSLRYRRARVSGVPDYAHETMLVQRTHEGSPGVFLVTPVITRGSDSATIVVRGWIYAPDGVRADRSRWHEGDSLTVDGYLDELPTASSPDSIPGQPAAVRHLQRGDLAHRAGRPVRAMYLWAVADSSASHAPPVAGGDAAHQAPARFTLPVLDEGPHRSYAIQWFAFAAIALGGAVIVVRNERRTSDTPALRPIDRNS
ncbi:MAG: SURF1 family protein [Gemmatimonadaceae bacterium]